MFDQVLNPFGSVFAVWLVALITLYAVAPPSTGNATPVIYDASSEIRNNAAFATSSGRAGRPVGTCPPRFTTRVSGVSPGGN